MGLNRGNTVVQIVVKQGIFFNFDYFSYMSEIRENSLFISWVGELKDALSSLLFLLPIRSNLFYVDCFRFLVSRKLEICFSFIPKMYLINNFSFFLICCDPKNLLFYWFICFHFVTRKKSFVSFIYFWSYSFIRIIFFALQFLQMTKLNLNISLKLIFDQKFADLLNFHPKWAISQLCRRNLNYK